MMGEAIKFGRGKLVTIDPVFENNDWSKIISACQRGVIPDTWKVGDQKAMMIGDVEYHIDIIGKNHDSYSDGTGKAPLTFQLHERYNTGYPMRDILSNSGGWEVTLMRSTHLPAIMSLMPIEVQSAIREVNKLTGQGGTSSTIITTADKLFLLSVFEILGRTDNTASGEGTRYEYYSNGGSALKSTTDGTIGTWGTRSPFNLSTLTQGYAVVTTYDNATASIGSGAATTAYRPSFAFCF